MFDSEQEINQKLGNCVVWYKHKPFLVNGASSRTSLIGMYCSDLNTLGAQGHRVNLTDAELDYKNLGEKLGYVNLNTCGRMPLPQALFLMRQPIRRSIQGLHENNVYIQDARYHNAHREATPVRYTWRTVYVENALELQNTIESKYPSVREIRMEFSRNKDLVSRAFDRNWAIEKSTDRLGPEFNLIYKMNKVGYTEDLTRLRVSKRYELLERDLKDLGVA